MEEGKFDGVFMQIIQQNQGIEGFYAEVFGFLRRKTDFFSNPKQGEETIRKQFAEQLIKFNERKIQEEKEKKIREQKEQQRQEKLRQQQQFQETKVEQPKVIQPKVEQKPVEVVKQTEASKEDQQSEEKKEEDNTPPPLGNGGQTDRYSWTQTLDELHMYIPVEAHIKGKQIDVKITLQHLHVTINKQDFINQDFPEKVNVGDCLWTLETSGAEKFIHIHIQKWSGQMHWWECALVGDLKINTQKIQPENSKLSDLEGETRTTVEKMMFDMRQKQQGLPSSDELQKQDMLKKFMTQHPEMDFSKCKFN